MTGEEATPTSYWKGWVMKDTDEVQAYGKALRAVRKLSDAPLAFGGPLRGGAIVVNQVYGGATRSLYGLHVLPGRGLGGQAYQDQRLSSVRDYGGALTITHHYDRQVLTEGVRGLTAVPVVVDRSVRGILYVASKSAGLPGDVVTGPMLKVSQSLSRELSINDEVERRVHDALAEASEPAAHQRQRLDELQAELCGIAAELDNPDLQDRVHAAARRLGSWSTGDTADDPDAPPPESDLSPRELDVLAQVELGYTNAEVGRRLELRPETVKAYLRSASGKLDVHGRYQAVMAARRQGLLAGRRHI